VYARTRDGRARQRWRTKKKDGEKEERKENDRKYSETTKEKVGKE
jgi:hypothetical protein